MKSDQTALRDLTKWTREMEDEARAHWRAHESSYGVPRYNQKNEEWMADLPALFTMHFSGWTWEEIYTTWRKAVFEAQGKEEDGKPESRTLDFARVKAMILQTEKIVDPSKMLERPKTEAELELEEIKRRHEAMTDDEKIAWWVTQLAKSDKEGQKQFDLVAAGCPKEVFAAMFSEFGVTDQETVKYDVWTDWVAYCRGKNVEVGGFEGDDKMEKSTAYVEQKLRNRNDKDASELEVRKKVFGRRAIFRVYAEKERKYYHANHEL